MWLLYTFVDHPLHLHFCVLTSLCSFVSGLGSNRIHKKDSLPSETVSSLHDMKEVGLAGPKMPFSRNGVGARAKSTPQRFSLTRIDCPCFISDLKSKIHVEKEYDMV